MATSFITHRVSPTGLSKYDDWHKMDHLVQLAVDCLFVCWMLFSRYWGKPRTLALFHRLVYSPDFLVSDFLLLFLQEQESIYTHSSSTVPSIHGKQWTVLLTVFNIDRKFLTRAFWGHLWVRLWCGRSTFLASPNVLCIAICGPDMRFSFSVIWS